MTTLTADFLFAAVRWADRVAAKRLVDCRECGGSGRQGVEVWHNANCDIGPCTDCDGTGKREIEVEPVEGDDG